MARNRSSAKRRLMAAMVLGLVGTVAVPGAARAQAEPEPYTQLLVTTSANDLRLPWQSVPAVMGVLGTKAGDRQELARFLQEQQAALQAAYAAAIKAAARRGPAASAVVERARSRCGDDFACFKQCTLDIESDGNYGAVSPGGTYRGAWQFDQPTWDGAVARAGYPEWSGRDPAAAPPGVQDAAAHQLYGERGNQPWGGRC